MICKHGKHIHHSWEECGKCKDEAVEREQRWDMLEHARQQTELLRRREQQSAKTGVCWCCGQHFHEPTRVFPAVGKTWNPPLDRFETKGICPKCYMEYAYVHGLEREKTQDEWVAYWQARIRAAASSDDAVALSRELDEEWPDLAREAEQRSRDLLEAEDARERAALERSIEGGRSPAELRELAKQAGSRWPSLHKLALQRAESLERADAEAFIERTESATSLERLAGKAERKWPELARAARAKAKAKRDAEAAAKVAVGKRDARRTIEATDDAEELQALAERFESRGWDDVAQEARYKAKDQYNRERERALKLRSRRARRRNR